MRNVKLKLIKLKKVQTIKNQIQYKSQAG